MNKAIPETEKQLIEASKDSKLKFVEISQHLNEIRFISIYKKFKFYRILIQVFKNQKEDFMKHLQIPENVLTFDEFEIILTENVEMLSPKLKKIMKSLGTFFLSYKFYRFVNDSKPINLKPYFDKLINYENEELVVVFELIEPTTYFEYFVHKEKNSEAIFYDTIDLSKEQKECFYKNREIMVNCFSVFEKIIKVLKIDEQNNEVNYFYNASNLIKVLDENPEMHPTLMRRRLEPLIEKTLELDSLELLKKIADVLESEINSKDLHKIMSELLYTKNFFDKCRAKENCKDFFLDFVRKLKEKIKET